ncbi:hypothetical protein L915_14466 [Phytophthora nicotianae]|uniref:Uncharacterized protein n=1 Tax=Phytophthora nicotianae TaxID=4792 RepID=W2G9E7_PHYNI|nr:hypothetical protein L915_14466 [Phytophthora nicotianae]
MAFRVRWCKMKKNGWTTKKPLGLSVDFIYLKPRKTIKDVEGEDVFTGEEAAMKYLEKIDLGCTEYSAGCLRSVLTVLCEQRRFEHRSRQDVMDLETLPDVETLRKLSNLLQQSLPILPHPTAAPRYIHPRQFNGNFSRLTQFVYVPEARHTLLRHHLLAHHWILLQVHQRTYYKLILRMTQLFLPVNILPEAQKTLQLVKETWIQILKKPN